MIRLETAVAVAAAAIGIASRAAPREMTAPAGVARVGFAIDTGTWKNNPDGTRAFAGDGQVTHGQMRSLSVATNGNVVTAIWKGHPKCGDGFTVAATMTLRPDGGFEYTGFEYSGNESESYVRRIAFPLAVVPRTGRTALFVPNKTGEIRRPDWSKARPGQILYKTHDMGFVYGCIAALEEGGVSHFLDQRGDARRHSAALLTYPGGKPGTLVLRNSCDMPVTDATRRAGRMPYPGVYAPFRGGWYEAATMHREWLETQPWFKAAAARDFSKLREIALWMWGRGGIAVVEQPVLWFMKETGLKAALDWYWWHNVPYDTSYPFFWPPRDGEDAFRASVRRMKAAGAFVQVYTNGMLWDRDDGRWDGDGETTVDENGRAHTVVYNPYTKQRQAHMCGEAPKFQRMMRNLEKTLAGAGLDGAYIDMISCAAMGPCFNPRHSHAPGGGTARVDGYREYVRKIATDNPGFVLSSETTSESFLDRFEAFIVLYSSWERTHNGTLPQSEPVPAVTVIYRGAAVLFGSFATPGGIPAWDPLWGEGRDTPATESIVAKYPDQFAVEFARGVVWGIQPMVHNFTMRDVADPRLAGDIKFMKDTARFYFDNRDFLFDGRMAKPAKLACAARRVDFLCAGSYTRPHEAKSCTQKALPAVFHSEWIAPDGRRASVLANWTRDEQRCELETESGKKTCTLPPRSWKLLPLDPPPGR